MLNVPATTNLTPDPLAPATGYDGSPAEYIALRLATGNKWFNNGLIHFTPMVKNKLRIPRIQVSNVIKRSEPTPTDQGQADYSEQIVDPGELEIYYRFNPRNYEQLWDFMQPSGELMWREAPPVVLSALLEATSRIAITNMERNIATGDSTSATVGDNIFDGIITQLNADANTNQVATPVALTLANVEDEFRRLVDTAPEAVQEDPGAKIVVPFAVGKALQRADYQQANKGATFMDAQRNLFFEGYPVIPMVGMRANTMLFCKMTPNEDSGLWGAVDNSLESFNTFKIERWRPESELYFIQMKFKVGFGYPYAEEVALYYGP